MKIQGLARAIAVLAILFVATSVQAAEAKDKTGEWKVKGRLVGSANRAEEGQPHVVRIPYP